jgi:uncharacterized protein YbdZ (MbtH family)
MSAVLVYDRLTEIPEGWLVVRGGPIQAGDRWTCQVLGGVAWSDVPPEHIGKDSMPRICVIRREER